MKPFREGAIGALLDEYERAITDLKTVIKNIDANALVTIVDAETADEDCRSVQNILSHVVHSGHGYAVNIHNLKGHAMVRPPKTYHPTVDDYIADLTSLLAFTEDVFAEYKNSEIEEMDNNLKIKTHWGQLYDAEQMMEHAIVHILRHRRQIEKIKLTKLA
jgi:uncharacterized damage-inducible protein DinB